MNSVGPMVNNSVSSWRFFSGRIHVIADVFPEIHAFFRPWLTDRYGANLLTRASVLVHQALGIWISKFTSPGNKVIVSWLMLALFSFVDLRPTALSLGRLIQYSRPIRDRIARLLGMVPHVCCSAGGCGRTPYKGYRFANTRNCQDRRRQDRGLSIWISVLVWVVVPICVAAY